MEKVFDNKINLLKALGILLVVSGHLDFALIPMFPPYSFQVVLFFFIAGMLYNENYSFKEYFIRRFKSLMIPYFVYCFIYLGITLLLKPLTGHLWAASGKIGYQILAQLFVGHQLDLIAPLWFVPQLFLSLILFKLFSRANFTVKGGLTFYIILALSAVILTESADDIYIVLLIKTLFTLLFIYLGTIYKTKIEGKINIFTPKIFYFVIILQSLLWLTNADIKDGIGLSYVLAWGKFDNWVVPFLTSLTGIWISLFIIEVTYDKIKDWNFLKKIGQNTYHIMANHLLVFNIITYLILLIKGVSFDVRHKELIYWIYAPLKLKYFYFVFGIIITTYFGEFLKFLKSKIKALKAS